MAISRTAAIVLAAANASAICASQTPGAGALALNGAAVAGGIALLDAARRVLVTTTANELGKTLTLVGVDRERNPIQEVLALPNAGTVFTQQDFFRVTSASISAAAAGPLAVGTNGTASTRWIRLDPAMPNFGASLGVNFGGVAASATVEVTLDPVDKSMSDRMNGSYDESAAGLPGAFVPPVPFAASGAAALTTDTLVAMTTPAQAVRLTVSSGAATAGVRLTVLQQGIRA